MSSSLDKSILAEDEVLFLEGVCRLGRKAWFGNEFSQNDSDYYVTSRRILIHTPQKSRLEKVVGNILLSAAGALFGVNTAQVHVMKCLNNLNPNEGNVLEIPLQAIERVDVITRSLLIPVNEVVLSISGEILPIELNGADLKGTAAMKFAAAVERARTAPIKAA